MSTIDSVCLSVCLCVCLSRLFKLLLLFCFSMHGIEPFFGRRFSMLHSTKLFSSIFDLSPLTPKIYSTKIFLHKIAYKSACMADRPQMFGPTRGEGWGWPIQWNHAKCCGADPCCHGNEIWARRGDPVACRPACYYDFLALRLFADNDKNVEFF